MGYILATGAISRIVGPFWAVQSLIVGPFLTFGITAFMNFVGIVVFLIFRKECEPHWSYLIDQFEAVEQINTTTTRLLMRYAVSYFLIYYFQPCFSDGLHHLSGAEAKEDA